MLIVTAYCVVLHYAVSCGKLLNVSIINTTKVKFDYTKVEFFMLDSVD
jgi:hypothetical protein